MSRRLHPIELPSAPAGTLPHSAEDWLESLPGAVVFRAPGRDRGRCRVMVTLLHGNEPSGLRALHAWLSEGASAAVDLLVIVASVETALEEPRFSHRMRPGCRDLNRCFLGPFDTDPEGRLAGEILAAILEARPEALVDIHNNTGHNPPYSVGAVADAAHRNLAALFGDRLVHTRLRLGALMEATEGHVPSVTFEAGRAGNPEADQRALEGLRRFAGEEDVLARPSGPPPLVLRDPARVCVAPQVQLAYGEGPVEGADLTLHLDVDRHNFEQLEAGTPLGWVRAGAPWPVVVHGEDGADRSRELFALEGDRLSARRALVPIMMTTDPGIATADCLFYVVRRPREGDEEEVA